MAGDWIKVEKATAGKLEVLQLAERLGVTADHALGLVVRFWSWCDDQLSDGHARGVTPVTLDAHFHAPGLCDSLVKVGWLRVRDGSLEVPNFDRHLSQSAKNRALAAERQRVKRHEKPSRLQRDKSVTREEKRRDREVTTLLLPGPGEDAGPVTATPAWSADAGWTGIQPEERQRWAEAYPACNIDRQLAAMDAWLRANPTKAVKRQWRRFITNWLSRSQDRGGDNGPGRRPGAEVVARPEVIRADIDRQTAARAAERQQVEQEAAERRTRHAALCGLSDDAKRAIHGDWCGAARNLVRRQARQDRDPLDVPAGAGVDDWWEIARKRGLL